MTDAQKLEKIISRAVENGWDVTCYKVHMYPIDADSHVHIKKAEIGSEIWDIEKLLFNHDFCKAAYGTKPTCYICGGTEVRGGEMHTDVTLEYFANCAKCGAEWMDKLEFEDEGNYLPAHLYHIQQLALSDDRIDYLYKFMEE